MLKYLVMIVSIVSWNAGAWAGSDASSGSEVTASVSEEDGGETELVAEEVDLEAAEKIFQRSCRACHGNKAQGAASYPKLSDKEPAHIAEMLERYRSGEKIGPNSVLMIQQAKKLSDEDIAGLAVYVATAFD